MPNPDSQLNHRRFKCRHIFTDGRRCGSPALRSEDFCYYHHTTRRPLPPKTSHQDPYNDPPNQTTLTLPTPEDPSAIQYSIGEVMDALARNALDPRRAGLLLYALQIASQNLKNNPRKEDKRLLPPERIVEEVTVDPEYGTVAPASELEEDDEPQDFLGQRTLNRLIRRLEEIDEDPPAAALPSLHASTTPPRAPMPPARHPLRCRPKHRSRPKSLIERTLAKQ